jgi:hypothetical protein
MKLWQQLARTEAAAIVALLITAGVMAAYGAVHAIRSPGMIGPAGVAQLAFQATLIYGVVPVTAFGAPCYVWLSRRGLATWRSIFLVALAPAAPLVLMDMNLALMALLCGSTIAGLTQCACRKWVRPNNPSRPTRLRGAA